MSYLVLQEPVIFEEIIKKSRFITYLKYVENLEQAKEFVAEIRKEHPKARHHCWAAVAGRPDESNLYGFSDDGEPTGTAGSPMHTVLVNSKLGNIVSVCVRYFGGILLGTGGLVRAYSNGTAQALKLAVTQEKIFRDAYRIVLPYPHLGLVNNLLESVQVVITHQDFGAFEVTIDFLIRPEDVESLAGQIINRSAGQLQIIKVDD